MYDSITGRLSGTWQYLTEEVKIELRRMQSGEKLYYLAFMCILTWQGIRWTTATHVLFIPVGLFSLLMQCLFMVTIVGSILLQKWTKKETVLLTVVFSVLLVSALTCDIREMVFSFFLVIAGRRASFKKLAFMVFVFSSLVLSFTLLGASLGLLEVRYSSVSIGRPVRCAWGFVHPNRLGFTVLLLCMSWCVIRFPNLRLPDAVFGLICFSAISFVIESRTSALTLLLMVVVIFAYQLLRNRKGLGRVISIAYLLMGALLIGLSIYLMICFNPDNSFHQMLNRTFTGRFSFANEYYTDYPPTLFGTSFENTPVRTEVDGARFVVDNAFARLVIVYGYLAAALWFISFVALCVKNAWEDSASLSFVCLGVMVVLGFAESMALVFTSNYTLIAFAGLFMNNEESGLEKQQSTHPVEKNIMGRRND